MHQMQQSVIQQEHLLLRMMMQLVFITINDVSTSDESNVATNMTVTLSAAAGRDVTVDYATSMVQQLQVPIIHQLVEH